MIIEATLAGGLIEARGFNLGQPVRMRQWEVGGDDVACMDPDQTLGIGAAR